MLGEVLECKLPSESTTHMNSLNRYLQAKLPVLLTKHKVKYTLACAFMAGKCHQSAFQKKNGRNLSLSQGIIWDLKASLDVSDQFSGMKFLSKGKCLVIFSCSYRKAAQHISALHLDRPMHALNRTVYWLEYILRHHGAPYLRPAVYDLSLYEYFCLDILALLLLCLAGVAFVLYKSVVWCRRKGASPVYQNGNCMKGHFTDEKKLQ